MNYSPDPLVDGDPKEAKEPLQEIPKSKSTHRGRRLSPFMALWKLKKAKSRLYLEG
jgi:hypothetical protein